jgi:phospholipid transport system transporter-binding protein
LESLGGGRFRVSGVLDATTAGDLLQQGTERFANQNRIEIDFAGVTDSDSAGLALLIEWMRIVKVAKGEIHFVNAPGQVSALARISEVDDLLFPGTQSPAAPETV